LTVRAFACLTMPVAWVQSGSERLLAGGDSGCGVRPIEAAVLSARIGRA
jgi:hypothetical protein